MYVVVPLSSSHERIGRTSLAMIWTLVILRPLQSSIEWLALVNNAQI